VDALGLKDFTLVVQVNIFSCFDIQISCAVATCKA
jgi:hypothetical protein